MNSSHLSAELANVHRRDLIAAAENHRLARAARQGRCDDSTVPTRRIRRTWVRSATQPAHS